MELVPTIFHFPTFLSEIQQICLLRAEQKNIAFIYQLSPHLPVAIYADEKRLRQILINLLGNAIKFTETGSVTLKIDLLESVPQTSINPLITLPNISSTARLRFQIEDTGIGINSQQLSKIFTPF